jgi:hypothetical protein
MGYGSRIAQPRPDRTPNTAAETVTHSLVIAPRGHHCADRRLPALNDRIAGRWPLRHCRSHRQAFYTSHLAEEWTPRELRHSFVSLLSSAGIPIEDIAHLVGHPCAINPDGRLRSHAEENDWQIRDYRTGRKAVRLGLVGAGATGAAAGAVAAGLAVRRALRN